MILYELVTGESPYPDTGSMPRLLRHITETVPGRPPRRNRQLGDDMDTIISKALEKDPARRYQSADALAVDVERYLAGHPIVAKPHSNVYVLGKVIARNKAIAVLAAGLLFSLVVLAVVTTVQGRRVSRDRDRAVAAEALARQLAYEARRSLYLNRINAAWCHPVR